MEQNSDITSGIRTKILRGLEMSIEKKDKNTFNALKSFIRRTIQLSIQEK